MANFPSVIDSRFVIAIYRWLRTITGRPLRSLFRSKFDAVDFLLSSVSGKFQSSCLYLLRSLEASLSRFRKVKLLTVPINFVALWRCNSTLPLRIIRNLLFIYLFIYLLSKSYIKDRLNSINRLPRSVGIFTQVQVLSIGLIGITDICVIRRFFWAS